MYMFMFCVCVDVQSIYFHSYSFLPSFMKAFVVVSATKEIVVIIQHIFLNKNKKIDIVKSHIFLRSFINTKTALL